MEMLYRKNGFTLLELLVTVTLISVSLVIVLGAFSLSLRTSDITKDHLKANVLLDNNLSELEFKAVQQGIEDNEYELDLEEGFSGTQKISSEEDSILSLVETQISWAKGEKKISTYVINKKEGSGGVSSPL